MANNKNVGNINTAATNKTGFDSAAFFTGAYHAPLQMGKHSVVLNNVKAVIEETDNGPVYFITVPMTFNNNRVVTHNFYAVGMKYFCDATRKQLNDLNDYDLIQDYLDTLNGKTLDVTLSVEKYTAKDGSIKSTIKYDFSNAVPAADVAANSTVEVEV